MDDMSIRSAWTFDGSFVDPVLLAKEIPAPEGGFSGDWKESVISYLRSPFDFLSISVVPTWRCTLRCPFCYVLKNLSKEETVPDTDLSHLQAFVADWIDTFGPKEVKLWFIGGEIGLATNRCVLAIDAVRSVCAERSVPCRFGCTTNMTVPIDDEVYGLMSRMNDIMVSIDGDAKLHNAQRKVFDKSVKDPYATAIRNLKELKDRSTDILDRVTIQSAIDFGFLNKSESEQRIKEAMFVLNVIGVPKKNIRIGYLSQTATWSPSEKAKHHTLRSRPCCTYRSGGQFVLIGNDLYASYFRPHGSKIGSLSSSAKDVFEQHVEYATKELQVLKDEKCLRCPALPICWGQCEGSEDMRAQPSASCNQSAMLDKLSKFKSKQDVERHFLHTS